VSLLKRLRFMFVSLHELKNHQKAMRKLLFKQDKVSRPAT